MSQKNLYYFSLFFILLFASCIKDNFDSSLEGDDSSFSDDDQEENLPLDITKLTIPDGFDFGTQQNITVLISDARANVKYDVYAYNDELIEGDIITYENQEGEFITEPQLLTDILNQLLFTGVAINGKLTHQIALPSYYTQLYIRSKLNNKYSSEVVTIIDKKAEYEYNGASNTTGKSGVLDYLYCVNGNAELFQVDPLDGTFTAISEMPMGSYTAAIDQENKVLYSIGRSSPYPLMKYTILDNEWETVANLGRGGPRLDYSATDGLLYFANADVLYTIDPLNGKFLSSWKIKGLDNKGGGDLAFSEDGILFMCTFSGLYKMTLGQDGDYLADRISGDNLPFNPTSMTFDSNQELWLANNASSSDLIIMDTETGGWEYRYGVSANNNTDVGRTINDLTTFRVFDENQEPKDTDGDGIFDGDDEFPEDPDKAFEVFTPSKYGFGTVAFEDLWPFSGDYDFNDVAVNYKIIAVQNAANEVVQVDFNITAKSNGASFVNAFAVEFENLNPSQIESVNGQALSEGYIELNANGTEANQENAVIVFYDNNNAVLNEPMTISIKFTEPITTTELGTAPFNPFIIVNKTRIKEIHLPFANTTTLGEKTVDQDGVNKDPNGNYVTEQGLPWAINIVHDFKVPREKISVNKAYNFFAAWATSGGKTNADWYKDGAGNRNLELLVQ